METNPLKAVFILPALTAGGAERVLITLMNTLDRSRHQPFFLTVSEEGPMRDYIDPDIPFHSLKARRVLMSLPKLYLKLKTLHPDIVISTMAHMNFAVLLLKPFFPQTRFIVREAIVPSYFFNTHPLLTLAIKTAYRCLYPLADRVISPAQAIIDEFRNDLRMNCQNHCLLRNPVDIDRIRAGENTPFEIMQERKNTVHFVAAGRLHPQKGFDRLIKALSQINIPHPWKLDILGEGPERRSLEALTRKHNLSQQIKLLGLIQHPWPHYARADCFLLPSRWEGLPNVVLESLACGTSVIATRESGGIAEIAEVATQGAVTVVEDMNAFTRAMEKMRPASSNTFRPSLLPEVFQKKNIIRNFLDILDNVTQPQNRVR